MSVLTIVLTVGLIARLTRLICRDQITDPFRMRILRWFGGDSWIYYLVCCSWCMSIWVGGAVSTVAWFYGTHPAFVIVAVAALGAMITGYSASWLEPEAADQDAN